MKNYLRRETLVLLLTLGVLLLPLLGAGLYLYQKHQWAQERMAELEPRYARLLGLEANRDNLAQARERAQGLLAQYLAPADQDANQIGNAAQQQIRTLLTSAGLGIASSQVLDAKEDKGGFERIPLAVRAEGEMLAVQTALAALTEQKPAILLDSVTVQGLGAPVRGVQRLSVQLNLSIVRVRP